MLAGIRSLGLHVLPWTDSARQLQARIESLRIWRTEEAWPDVSDAGLSQDLDSWLAPHLSGITRLEHLTRLDLTALLNSQLDYEQQQRHNQPAPSPLEENGRAPGRERGCQN